MLKLEERIVKDFFPNFIQTGLFKLFRGFGCAAKPIQTLPSSPLRNPGKRVSFIKLFLSDTECWYQFILNGLEFIWSLSDMWKFTLDFFIIILML